MQATQSTGNAYRYNPFKNDILNNEYKRVAKYFLNNGARNATQALNDAYDVMLRFGGVALQSKAAGVESASGNIGAASKDMQKYVNQKLYGYKVQDLDQEAVQQLYIQDVRRPQMQQRYPFFANLADVLERAIVNNVTAEEKQWLDELNAGWTEDDQTRYFRAHSRNGLSDEDREYYTQMGQNYINQWGIPSVDPEVIKFYQNLPAMVEGYMREDGSLTKYQKQMMEELWNEWDYDESDYFNAAWHDMTRRDGTLNDEQKAHYEAMAQAKAQEMGLDLNYQPFEMGEWETWLEDYYRKNTLAGAEEWHKLDPENSTTQSNLYWMQQREKYDPLSEAPDFEEKSAVNEENLTYLQPFNIGMSEEEEAKAVYSLINDLGNARDSVWNNLDPVTNYPKYYKYRFVDEEERKKFNYLWETQGYQAAMEYAKNVLDYSLRARETEKYEKNLYSISNESASNKNFISGPLNWASAYSVPLNFTSGMNFLYTSGQNIRNKFVDAGEYMPVDYNTRPTGKLAEATRSGVMDSTDWKVNIFGREVDLFDELYGTGMSMVDSMAATATGNPLAAALIMGGQAAESTQQAIIEKGGNADQAMVGGLLAGGFESLFESVSVGKFFDEAKSMGKDAFKEHMVSLTQQIFTNATEEVCTDIANMFADYFLMGDQNDYARAVEKYRLLGVEDPEKMARQDIYFQLARTALSGAAMGAGFGAVSETASEINTRRFDQEIGEGFTNINNMKLLKELGMSFDKGSMAFKLAQKYNIDKASARETGRLYRAITDATPREMQGPVNEMMQQEIETKLRSLGEVGNVSKVALGIVEFLQGVDMDPEAYQALAQSQHGLEVAKEMMDTTAGETTTEEEKNDDDTPPWEEPEATETAEEEQLETVESEQWQTIDAAIDNIREEHRTMRKEDRMAQEKEWAAQENTMAVEKGQQLAEEERARQKQLEADREDVRTERKADRMAVDMETMAQEDAAVQPKHATVEAAEVQAVKAEEDDIAGESPERKHVMPDEPIMMMTSPDIDIMATEEDIAGVSPVRQQPPGGTDITPEFQVNEEVNTDAQSTDAQPEGAAKGVMQAFAEAAASAAEGKAAQVVSNLIGQKPIVYRTNEDGDIEVREDGQAVALEDSSLTEEEKQILMEGKGMGPNVLRIVMQEFNAHKAELQAIQGEMQDAAKLAADYTRGFKRAIQAAMAGKELSGLYIDLIGESGKKTALEMGQKINQQRAMKVAQNTGAIARELGLKLLDKADSGRFTQQTGVRLGGISRQLENITKNYLQVLDWFGKKHGIQFRIYENITKDNVNANGTYKRGGNIINLSLNAQEGLITKAASHEVGHYIKNWSPEAYKDLQNLVLSSLEDADGYDLNNRIRDMQETYRSAGIELSEEDAKEEITNDGLLDYIANDKNLMEMAASNSTLLQKIRENLNKIMQTIRQAISRLAKDSQEAKALKNDHAYLQQRDKMIESALKMAGAQMQKAMAGAYGAAAKNEAVTEYRMEYGKATSLADRQAALNGLAARIFMQTQKAWLEKNRNADIDLSLKEFRGALLRYGKGEAFVATALEAAGFIAPAEGSENMLLSAYLGRQEAMMEGETDGETEENAADAENNSANAEDVKYSLQNDLNYSYDALIKKENIPLTQLEDVTQEAEEAVKNQNNRDFAKYIIEKIREKNGGEAYIPNKDTGKSVLVGVESIKHSMTRGSLKAYIQVVMDLDGLLRNAVAINELNPRDRSTNYSTILLGVGETEGTIMPVRFIVNNKTWKMESYDILYAISKSEIKKEEARISAPGLPNESDFGTSSEISVADLLNIVKDMPEIASIISKDVAERLGIERPYNAKITDNLKYSLQPPTESLPDVGEDAELSAQVATDKDAKAALQMVQKLYSMATQGKGYLGDVTGEAAIQPGAWKNRLQDVAEKLKKETGTDYSDKYIRNSLSKIFTAMDKGESLGDILMYARDFGKRMLKHTPGMVAEKDPTIREAQRILKDSRFFLTDDMKSEIRETYGSLQAYMRKNFGKLGIRNKATASRSGASMSLSEVWQDLSSLMPGTFPADATEADMPGIVDAFLETAGQKDFGGAYGKNIGAYSTDLGLSVMLEYFSLPGAIGKENQSIEKQNNELFEMRKKEREKYEERTQKLQEKLEAYRAEFKNKYEYRIATLQAKLEYGKAREDLSKEIVSTVKYMNNTMLKGTDTRHVPDGLHNAILDAMAPFLNSTSVFTKKEVLKLQQEYNRLNNEYANDETEAARMYDVDIMMAIQELSTTVSGKLLSDLSLNELWLVRDVVANLKKMITDENEIRMNGRQISAEVIGDASVSELGEKKDVKTEKIQNLTYKNTTPIYFFKRIGGVFQAMYEDIRTGHGQWAKWTKSAREYADRMIEKYKVNDWLQDKNTLRFTTKRGEVIELNKQMALSLYATWKREITNTVQNANHLRMGGFVYPKGMKAYEGVDMKKPHPLSFADMVKIEDYLGDDARNFADEMVNYLSNDMAAIGNKVSVELYGYRKFTERYYFPYQSSSDFLNRDLTKGDVSMEDASGALKNWGAAKKLQTKANNPIVIGNFMDVWSGHVNKMAIYGAFTVPVDNMNRIYNYKQKKRISGSEQDGTAIYEYKSIKQEMNRVYGAGAERYIATLMRDIAGGVRAQDRTGAGKLISKFKKGATAANLQVVVQQFSSLARAMAVMNPRYLAFTPPDHRQDIAEMREHSGLAIIKEMGRFDTGTGLSAVQWLQEGIQDESKLKRFGKWLDNSAGFLAEKADLITWSKIWRAAKREIADTTNLAAGTQEYWDAVTRRFEEVIDMTQVYDSTLSKSELMRSNSTFDKMTTSFMAESTVTFNMLQDAFVHVKEMGGKRKLLRATSVWICAAMFNAILKSIISATRRKDDEERTYLEKYAAEVWGNFTGDLNPMGMVPIARDIMSLLEGYDVQRADMEIFSQMVDAWDTVTNDNKTFYEKMKAVTGAVGNMIGIPAGNVWRDMEGILGLFKSPLVNGTSWRDIKYTVLDDTPPVLGKFEIWDDSRATYYNRIAQAMAAGDQATVDELKGYLMETEGVKEGSLKTGVNGAIRDMYLGGRIDAGMAAQLLEEMGKDENEAYFTVEKWREEAAHSDDPEYSYSKLDPFTEAVISGQGIKEEMDEMLNHGMEKGDIQSAVAKAFKDGKITESKARMILRQYFDKTENDAYWMVKEWAANKAHAGEKDYSYNRYENFFAAVETGRNLKAAINELTSHGVKKETISSQITSQYKKEYIRLYKTNKTAFANLQARLLTAYEALGYDRNKKMKDMQKWLKE